ncbi:MAG TPA: SagB family peptide dehydrogenase [Candidatus Limnocylindrales bacterium]|nr:SagB family peptide dehydrogenase [Candidatus Limnocylindrales bacterium]
MAKLRKPAYRRSPFLVFYWKDHDFVAENFSTGQKASIAPIACEVLHFFDRWRNADSLSAHLKQFTPQSLRKAVSQLVRKTFLERSGEKNPRAQKLLRAWDDWNPAAGFFHFTTRDTPYDSALDRIDAEVRSLARRDPMPRLAKSYPRARKTPLPAPHTQNEFSKALLGRRTWRRFSGETISLADLGTLLGLIFGVREWISIEGVGRFPLKTSPSAGAMHPIEAYVVAQRVENLARGIYHYDSARHELALLRRGASARETTRFLAGQEWFSGAAVILFLSAVFPRAQWKYRFPRAYRTVLIEAGHFCQTFCLTATSLGLAPFCTMALAETKIEKALGIDGVNEGVIYAAGAGKRPKGMDWETGATPEIWLERKKRR